MVQFLEEKQGISTAGLTPEELVELEQLRTKYEKLKQRTTKITVEDTTGAAAQNVSAANAANSQAMAGAGKKKRKSDSESSSDSEVSALLVRFQEASTSLKKGKTYGMLNYDCMRPISESVTYLSGIAVK